MGGVDEMAPRDLVERHPAPAPGAPPEPHRDLEQGELVSPRREAARAPETVELTQDRDDGVIGCLQTEVVQVTGHVWRKRVSTPKRLRPRHSMQYLVQSRVSLSPEWALASKLFQPACGIVVELG